MPSLFNALLSPGEQSLAELRDSEKRLGDQLAALRKAIHERETAETLPRQAAEYVGRTYREKDVYDGRTFWTYTLVVAVKTVGWASCVKFRNDGLRHLSTWFEEESLVRLDNARPLTRAQYDEARRDFIQRVEAATVGLDAVKTRS